MLQQHIPAGLGNDGFSNSMFTEMHTAYLVHKLVSGEPRVMGADQVMQIAFRHNAKTAGLFFPGPLGVLTPNALADVILVDYNPSTPLTDDNWPWHLTFGVDGTRFDPFSVRHLSRAGRPSAPSDEFAGGATGNPARN
jgi:cytosine/adenosine deaminase-related metal-dependent hydrolase